MSRAIPLVTDVSGDGPDTDDSYELAEARRLQPLYEDALRAAGKPVRTYADVAAETAAECARQAGLQERRARERQALRTRTAGDVAADVRAMLRRSDEVAEAVALRTALTAQSMRQAQALVHGGAR